MARTFLLTEKDRKYFETAAAELRAVAKNKDVALSFCPKEAAQRWQKLIDKKFFMLMVSDRWKASAAGKPDSEPLASNEFWRDNEDGTRTRCIAFTEWSFIRSDELHVAYLISADNPVYKIKDERKLNRDEVNAISSALGLEEYSFLSIEEYERFNFFLHLPEVLPQITQDNEDAIGFPTEVKVEKQYVFDGLPLFGTIKLLDKFSSRIFNAPVDMDKNGLVKFGVQLANETDKKNKINVSGKIAIDYSGLVEDGSVKGIEVLNSLDKSILGIVSAYYELASKETGNAKVPMSYRYLAQKEFRINMPNDAQIKKVKKSVYKMQTTLITIDNTKEASRYNYERCVLNRVPVLQGFEADLIYKGQSAAGFVLELPPKLTSFAMSRKQYCYVPFKVYSEIELSHTETNDKIIDYLIGRVARIKIGTANTNKVRYETVIDDCKIKNARLGRIKTTVRKCLEGMKRAGFIRNFEQGELLVTVSAADTSKAKNAPTQNKKR